LNKRLPIAVKEGRFIRVKLHLLKSIVYSCLALIFAGCLFASCEKSGVTIIPGKYNPNGHGVTGTTGVTGGSGTTVSDTSSSALLFSSPSDVAIDASGNLYVADYGNNMIRKITPGGALSVLAGNGGAGAVDGTGTAATFNGPTGIAVDASGNVYVADYHNNLVRKITPSGVVTTLAGTVANPADTTSSVLSVFSGPSGVAVDVSGNVYVADSGDNQIKLVSPSGTVTTLAGSGNAGSGDGAGSAATFYNPTGVALDASNNLYVADFLNNRIRKVSPAGVVSTLAGDTAGYADGPDTASSFYYPNSLTVDASGNVYVTDEVNNRIRMISPQGTVSTIAGSGAAGSLNGQGTNASFNGPDGIAIDASGNLYVADADNNLIRKISAGGQVTTLAGKLPGLSVHRTTGPMYYHSGIGLKHKLTLKAKFH
jgi:sugar lactone lactonase YvrE